MGALRSIEQEAVERASAEPMLEQVLGWSAINSGSRNLGGLERMGDVLADAFAGLPGLLRLENPAAVEAVDAAGRTVQVRHGRHLHLTVRPTAPLQLLFTGHMDTVFAADHPFQETRWIDETTLNGPGVADMKGGIAVMLAALKALEAAPAADRVGYEVVINSDEEVGSPASADLLAQAARGKRAALTYEPAALPDGTLAGARPGSGNFAIVVHGRSAHAGRNPEEGRNALLAAADLALHLAKSKYPGLSVNPSRIDGGSPSNVVPDLAILRVNMRPRTPEDEERAAALIDTAISNGLLAAETNGGHHCNRERARCADRRPRRVRPAAQAADHRCGSLVRARETRRRRPRPEHRLAAVWRSLRRQQHCRLRSAGRRHDGRSRWQDPQHGGIPDR